MCHNWLVETACTELENAVNPKKWSMGLPFFFVTTHVPGAQARPGWRSGLTSPRASYCHFPPAVFVAREYDLDGPWDSRFLATG